MLRLAGPAESVANLQLIDLATFKAYGSIKTTTDDVLLQAVLDAVHAAIYRLTGGRFIKSTGTPYDEVYEFGESREMFLEATPIIAVLSVDDGQLTGNGSFQVFRSLASTDYQVDTRAGSVRRVLWGAWSSGYSTRIQYTAGYATIPADLKMAAAEWGAVKYRRITESRLDKLSSSTDTESESYTRDDAPSAVLAVLERYRLTQAFVG